MKKRIVASLLSAACLLSLTACNNQPATETGGEAAYKVGISMYVMDAGMTSLLERMTQELEASDLNIEVVSTSADSSTEKQNSDIEDLVTKGCDLIWVQGFDRMAIVGALEYAYGEGVKVAISAEADTDAFTYRYANATDEETGIMQADWFIENYLSVNPDTTYNIAMCNGTQSTASGAGRRNGVIWTLEDSGYTNYEVVVEQDCDFLTENAQAWAEGLMTSHPEVNVIFCGNDDMAMGVANAIDAVGRTGEIILLGTDGQDVGLTLMEEGKMNATVRMNVEEIGGAMADSMIRCLDGSIELDENKVSFADQNKIYTMLDGTNYQDYISE